MIFHHLWILFFLPPVLVLVYVLSKKKRSSSVTLSSRELVKDIKPTFRVRGAKKMIWLRMMVIICFFLALARPRLPLEETKVESQGIDIALAIDCSGSMLAEDFRTGSKRINRLEAVKEVVCDFINKRKNDRIGLVAFAGRAYIVCPLTLDYPWLIENLRRVEIGSIEDGTSIGSALTSCLNRLKETQTKSKIVILLTDGVNNTGNISPLKAAEAAKALGMKVYTIGAGTKELAPYPVRGMFGQIQYQNVKIEIDEETLQKIAKTTGGEYYRAEDKESLRQIYADIDRLEKTTIEEKGFRQFKELFAWFLLVGLFLLFAEVLLSNTLFRRLP